MTLSDEARERIKNFHFEMEAMGVTPMYRGARNSHFAGPLQKAFVPESKDLLINGKNGVGKTYLAAAMLAFWRWYKPDLLAKWTTSAEILMEIRATFNGKGSESDVVSKYFRCDVLVLYDLGAEKVTDFSISTLQVLINRRVVHLKPTIVTTNLSMGDIAKMDPRIASRLGGFELIPLKGKDWRIG